MLFSSILIKNKWKPLLAFFYANNFYKKEIQFRLLQLLKTL